MNKEKLLETAKPILFNTEMVRAIQDGRKVQTRRIVKSHIDINKDCQFRKRLSCGDFDFGNENYYTLVSPKYEEGDILYIRETFNTVSNITMQDEVGVLYKSDNETEIYPTENGGSHTFEYCFDDKWKPSIHMPKKYARIFLRVTDVRVERLQDIELNDEIKSEGYPLGYELKENKTYSKDEHGEIDYLDDCEVEWWVNLWNSTSKDGYKWEDNPYVFVYEFEVIK